MVYWRMFFYVYLSEYYMIFGKRIGGMFEEKR